MSEKANSDNAAAAKTPTTPKLVWDDSALRTTYSNVVNAASTREEVSIFFGTNQTWNAGDAEYKVSLTDRMVLNPYAAKRLHTLLSRVLDEYERRHGVLDMAGREQTPTT
ncbi:MAG: DUF3467 domain-containing protein [Marinicaulis sp.]|nr:DUF3467 domain-containing protein [Marinicaulis sp.]